MGHNGTSSAHAARLDKLGTTGLLAAARTKPTRRRAPSTQATIARAVKAVRKAGLPVAAIKVAPDGTVIVIPGTPEAVPSSAPNPWDDEA
jgi:hypothetical protein